MHGHTNIKITANSLQNGQKYLQAIRIQTLSISRQFCKLCPCKWNETNSLEYLFFWKSYKSR